MAYDVYLKLIGKFDDQVIGESRAKYHVNWIDLNSFSFGSNSNTAGWASSGGQGTAKLSSITFRKDMDATSSRFHRGLTDGMGFRLAVIELTDPNTKLPRLRYDFIDVEVEGIQYSRDEEVITLSFKDMLVNQQPGVDDDIVEKVLNALNLIP
jgi:type VI protein secretion system component Hcp